MSATPVAAGPAGRALARLIRMRAAMAALAVLVLIALACVAGPALTGHDPDRTYPDLRQLPAGLAAQPDATHLDPALQRIAFRMRVRLDAVARDGEWLRSTAARLRPHLRGVYAASRWSNTAKATGAPSRSH